MARNKKDKIFDLFKSNFKITFFYKPSMEFQDTFYYLVLDDSIELRLKVIDGVVVIDSVFSITKSYIKPLYNTLVETIMNQSKLTVLISVLGDTGEIQQTCMLNNAPTIEDERYITVPIRMYEKWKNQNNNNVEKYGFYLLSVSDEEPTSTSNSEVKVVDVPVVRKIDPEKPQCIETPLDRIKQFLRSEIDDLVMENINDTIVQCFITPTDTFIIELVDHTIYIKELLASPEATLNLIKIMELMGILEKLTNFYPDVYIVSIMHKEIYRVCSMKNYKLIEEAQKLPINNLFKQAFHGFGTFKITI